ncbi:WNT1-inducible-signaling pathway protein 2 isoform X1 [Nerophis ophidion]|uniref:WNT1-inducible-signaling pathway protein 2 isoform X1 n=1 Tax=Nerophis ophidion TaxID=159077 RepID=UPI002ADFB68C|nr:WNT1-inducible-signaling pathway protein 2 isoform X1 [Nerophis ophidion]
MNRLLCDSVMALALLLLAVASQVLCQLCDRPCLCLRPVPQCHPGVPLVLDDCRCCQVCARQQGESCNQKFPCDAQRMLKCDYSASFPGGPGECVSREDLACKVNGISYQDGQSFQPSCDTYCHCRGGGVSCVSTCPLNVRMPTSDCPHPQHVRLPGKCCKEWVCENLENSVLQDAITAMRPNVRWPPSPVQAVSTCAEQSTQWSACSQSCGAGISTRVSNQNLACRLQMETRLCKVRPCHSQLPMPNRTMRGQQGQCTASYTSQGPIRLVHQGCHSTRSYQLHYCGRCTDSRCCTPFQTSTAQVTFRCPTGSLLQRAVMMIHSCACHANCPYAPFRNPALWGYRP